MLAPLYLVLSVRVIVRARAARVALGGDGGDKALVGRIPRPWQFRRICPLCAILLTLAESLGAAHGLLHAAGTALLAGRHVHAFALSGPRQNIRLRVAGMMLTFAALTIAAAACLWGALARGV